MTEGETKAPAPIGDKDFRRRDEALRREIEQQAEAEAPKPPQPDHATDGGVF
jgi:hypothetical protein